MLILIDQIINLYFNEFKNIISSEQNTWSNYIKIKEEMIFEYFFHWNMNEIIIWSKNKIKKFDPLILALFHELAFSIIQSLLLNVKEDLLNK